MNWREHPYLFANGKFKCLYNHIGKDWVAEIKGVCEVGFLIKLKGITSTRDAELQYCTLIARKIEDMTDEEAEHFLRLPQETNIGLWLPRSERFRYLLSIGVFPFEWPDDESVINSTLEGGEG